jgi:hypothetical protein
LAATAGPQRRLVSSYFRVTARQKAKIIHILYAQADWKQLSARLLRREEHWDVWTGWYEARLTGHSDLSEEDEIARVSLPNEVWNKGAAAANASLLRLAA